MEKSEFKNKIEKYVNLSDCEERQIIIEEINEYFPKFIIKKPDGSIGGIDYKRLYVCLESQPEEINTIYSVKEKIDIKKEIEIIDKEYDKWKLWLGVGGALAFIILLIYIILQWQTN